LFLGEIIKIPTHSHPPNADKVNVKEAIDKLKNEAKTSCEPTRNVVSKIVSDVSKITVSKLPPIDMLSQTVRRTRNKYNDYPTNPINITDLILPDQYKVTKTGIPFLLHDINKEGKRSLIFTTENNLDFLSESDVWMADGTFKSVPPLFSQLYTIHACKKNATYPLVYILMTDRTKETYSEIFKFLKTKKPNLKPSMLMVDFENAFISTFKEEFPTAVIRGCFFHFTQCVWRKIQNSGLQIKYGQDSEFALQVRLLCSLSFIPPNKVIEAFDELIESEYYIQNEELLESIIMYFEDTWIGRLGRRGRRGAHFNIDLWNCYQSVIDNKPRTNNAVEGWHHAFNGSLGAHHPPIWKFIKCLQLEQGK